MAHANFIDRAIASASQVLHGFDPNSYKRVLDERTIAIAFDEIAATTFEGTAALDLTVRLIARLHPSLVLIPLDPPARRAITALSRLARSINPEIEIVRKRTKVDVC